MARDDFMHEFTTIIG